MREVWDMTDDELVEITQDSEHPQFDYACFELDQRREARTDSRVAQATGRAQGEQPS